jgi:ribosome maturation factor RimP
LELDDLEVLGRGAGTTVRVVVDGADGVDVDRLAAVSGGISRLLDGPVGPAGPYRLEVTSPGLERRLRRPRHFEKAVGREVAVKLPGESIRGLLVAAGEQDFTVDSGGEQRVIRYETPSSVRTIFSVPAKPKPGKR